MHNNVVNTLKIRASNLMFHHFVIVIVYKMFIERILFITFVFYTNWS